MVTLSKNISTTLKTKQGDITEDEVTFHWGQGEGLLTLQIILLHTTSCIQLLLMVSTMYILA